MKTASAAYATSLTFEVYPCSDDLSAVMVHNKDITTTVTVMNESYHGVALTTYRRLALNLLLLYVEGPSCLTQVGLGL